MKKLLSLLVVLAAILGARRAQAGIPPVINQIPSPIVGRYADGVNPEQYVYPDAFNLHNLVYDDNNPSNTLTWAYEIVGPPKYQINGLAPINSGLIDVREIPPAQDINHSVAPGEINPDGLPNTITIRNQRLSPLGGSTAVTSETGIIDPQAVTFYVSDGLYATSSTVLFWTDVEGSSRLSNNPPHRPLYEDHMLYAWPVADTLEGHITTSTWTDGRGACLNVSQQGDNWGSFANPMGSIHLTDNMVYRIRLKMNCTQLTHGKTPFWDFILENWDGDASKGLNFYGMDTFFLDNEGGANAIINTSGGTEVTIYWAPAAFQTAQWKSTTTGIFAANPPPPNGNGIDYHNQKDARLRFRVMDLDARADLQNNQKYGSICLQNAIVETVPFSRRIYEATGTSTPPTPELYRATSLKSVHNNPNDPVPGNLIVTSLLGSTAYFNAGTLTLTPTGAARDNEIIQITPANNTLYQPEPGNWPTIADDWPIPWESDKLYELKIELSAPTVTDAAHPFDVLWMNMEPPTNEVITESYVTANHAIATPRNGTPQTYYMFYYSNKETQSRIAAYHFLRWRLRFGNTTNCNWPEPGNTQNTGAVRVHSIRVNKVRFQ